MATWFDGVESFVEVAWTDSPLTATGSCTWTDETPYVRVNPQLSCRRGRTTELADFAPGTMSVTFDNRTRRFDASNSASPIANSLLPMKQIRWRVVYSGTTAYLFTGLILGFPIAYPGMTDSTVTVQCVDRTRLLEQAALPASAYSAEVLADSPTYYWPLQEVDTDLASPAEVGGIDIQDPSRPSYAAVEANAMSYPIGGANGVKSSQDDVLVSRMISDTLASITVPATIDAWVTLTTASTSQIRVGQSTSDFFIVRPNASTIVVNYSSGGYKDSTGTDTGVSFSHSAVGTVHVAATVSGTTMTVYVNGVSVGTDTLVAGNYTISSITGTPNFSLITRAQTVGQIATYPTALSAARLLAHTEAGRSAWGHPYGERTGTRCDRVLDAISWPAADTDLSSGESFCGNWYPDSGSALAALRELEDAEQGLCFISGRGYLVFRDRQWQMTNTRSVNAQVVFDDDGTDVGYTAISVDGNHIDHIRNQVTVTYPGGSVSVKDATSVSAYGPQSDSVNANPLPAGASFLARQLANFRLRIRKDPATRVPAIEVKPRANMAASFAVATLEIGDRVQVIRRPSGGTGTISVFCQVQGIEHSMSADDWTIRLYLAPAPKSYTEAPYLIAGGSSAYSYVGVASGNLIPY